MKTSRIPTGVMNMMCMQTGCMCMFSCASMTNKFSEHKRYPNHI